MRRYAFSGKAGSGKDTAADIMIEKLGIKAKRTSFAKPLYEAMYAAQDSLGIERHKDREFLRFLADNIRKNRDDFFVRKLEGEIKKEKGEDSVIITDLRFPIEAEFLRRSGFVLVRIERIERKVDGDCHDSETALDNFDFDYYIFNDGTKEDFENSLSLLDRTVQGLQ